MQLKRRVVVIGGGAAGMMAAITAAHHGADAVLLEKNEKCGKKLHLTGKGRCNLTNATDTAGLIAATVRNGRFLYSAFNAMDAQGTMDFMEGIGVALKIERGRRVFPVSDRADDVNRAMQAKMKQSGVRVVLKTAVTGITPAFQISTTRGTYPADAVILATGGLSYPATGSTGEGLTFAQGLGHSIAPTFPSLAPIICAEGWLGGLEGLSLRNVRLTARVNNKTLYEETGEMLFTDVGVSGPLVLSASAVLADKFHAAPTLHIDMKPALDAATLDARILRDFSAEPNKNLSSILPKLVPARMTQIVLELAQLPADIKANAVTKVQRAALVRTLKKISLTATAAAGYKEAVITRGGVSTKEINPATLESKLVQGLFFAGECIDVDALTGGYNLQIAFSTGFLAGKSASEKRQLNC